MEVATSQRLSNWIDRMTSEECQSTPGEVAEIFALYSMLNCQRNAVTQHMNYAARAGSSR